MGKYKLTWKDLTLNDFKVYLFALFKAFIPKKKIEQPLKSEGFEATDNEKELVKKEMQNIKDKELEKSIVNLGLSINREDT